MFEHLVVENVQDRPRGSYGFARREGCSGGRYERFEYGFEGRREPSFEAHGARERERGRREGCGESDRRFERGFGSGRERSFDAHGERHAGFGGGAHERFERGLGGRRERLFDPGDLKLVILKLLFEQPSYGYQLIKTMEQRLAGGYTPSAGAIYPTLTMLEEEGLAIASSENDKKVYSVTPEGKEYLRTNKRLVDELFERLAEAGRGFRRGRSPEIMKAFMNLRGAVVARVSRESLTSEQVRKIADAIHAAAKAIDEL
jgi:DNA-binding PadR family transcriptional regulator